MRLARVPMHHPNSTSKAAHCRYKVAALAAAPSAVAVAGQTVVGLGLAVGLAPADPASQCLQRWQSARKSRFPARQHNNRARYLRRRNPLPHRSYHQGH